MARNLVLKDGVLSAVVESFEAVEVAQLEAEVTTKQEAVDGLQAQVDALNAQLSEAQVVLEDSKSDATRAAELVSEAAAATAGESTDESQPVHVDVQVEDSEAQL